MPAFLASLKVYLQPQVIAVLFLGFASGLPLALTGATFSIWLAEEGVSMTSIGLFSLIGMPYALKAFWAPLIDMVPIPLLSRWLGRRRSWLLVCQLALSVAIIGLGFSEPKEHLFVAAMWALAVTIASATQDIIIDAYRIEILKPSQQGAGAAVVQAGYHIGSKLVAGGLALLLSDHMGWERVYVIMAGVLWLATVASMFIGEPSVAPAPVKQRASLREYARLVNSLLRNLALLLCFVLFYKFGDAFAGAMFNPFLKAMEFTNTEIALIIKTYGFFAMIAGTFFGGWLVHYTGIYRALWIGGIVQMLSNLMYIAQLHAGHDQQLLVLTITVENISAGIGSAAFVAFLSSICNVSYTATQYAALSAIASLARIFLAAPSGLLVEELGWQQFFIISMAAALPGLVVLRMLKGSSFMNKA